VENQRGRVFKSDSWTKGSENTKRKDRRSVQLASPLKYKSAKILGIS